MSSILFIDDDTDLLEINFKYFTKEGYIVKTASTASEGIGLLKGFHPHCIILDIMMPEQTGFDTCRQIRSHSLAPIIFLSGCSNENDKINGLMLGADDYMIKPYSFRELMARIQVQIRRHQGFSNTAVLSYPPLSLDVVSHKAYYNKEEILLSHREYELLYLLVTHPNQTLTFEQIGTSMWEYYSECDRRTIMVIASRLRKKFEEYAGFSNIFETVWSRGYQFVAK